MHCSNRLRLHQTSKGAFSRYLHDAMVCSQAGINRFDPERRTGIG
jgi:hypothetical protein